MKQELITVNDINPIEIFTGDGLDEVLHNIEQEVLSFVPDLSTVTSRKEIASLARKVASSKIVLDNAGKDLVAEWKTKAKLVDSSRKASRDFLDLLRDRVRKPLTEWEKEEAERIEKEKLENELIIAYEEALNLDSIFNKEMEIAERERLIREKEEAEQQRIAYEEAEKERLKNEERIKKEAAESAKLKAEQESQRKIDEARRFEAEAIAKAERLEKEKLQDKANADRDKRNAVLEAERRARAEADRIENNIKQEEHRKQKEINRRNNDLNHKRTINSQALNSFVAEGIDTKTAKIIISLISKYKIQHISINY